MIHINFSYFVSRKKLHALSKKKVNDGILNQNLIDDDFESEVFPFYYTYKTRKFGVIRLKGELTEIDRVTDPISQGATKVNVKLPITFTFIVTLIALSLLLYVFYVAFSPLSMLIPLILGVMYIVLHTQHLISHVKKQLDQKLR